MRNALGGIRERSNFTDTILDTGATSALAVGAWLIPVTSDSIKPAPVTSSGNLIALQTCCRRG